MSDRINISELDAAGAAAIIPELVELLRDSVDNGSSVGFLLPLRLPEALAFWEGVAGAVVRGETLLLVARDAAGVVAGTVQLGLALRPNSLHRAEVQKLLVHTRARRRGVGRALMLAAERLAAERGRWLLVLDTRAGDPSEQLYAALGFTAVGQIPRYVIDETGTFTATAIYSKWLGALTVAREPIGAPESLALLAELTAAVDAIYGDGGKGGFDIADAQGVGAGFVVARLDGVAVGCGAYRPLEAGVAEIKRMYTVEAARRRGVARRILAALEDAARADGYRLVRLETGNRQPEAITLYEAAGYARSDPYGAYVGNSVSVCFAKILDADAGQPLR